MSQTDASNVDDENSPRLAPVVYAQPPLEELRRRFPVSIHPYYIAQRRFEPIALCEGVPGVHYGSAGSAPVEVDFKRILLIGRAWFIDELLPVIDRNHLRLAGYEELLCYDEKYSLEKRMYPLIAPGSTLRWNGRRYVPYVFDDGGGGRLGLHSLGRPLTSGTRILVVPK